MVTAMAHSILDSSRKVGISDNNKLLSAINRQTQISLRKAYNVDFKNETKLAPNQETTR
jgi:hypothetical protein